MWWHTRKNQIFVFRRKGRVHLNRQGRQFSRLLAAEVCASAVVMLDTPCSEVVKGTGYPLDSPVSPSFPLPCVTVCHHVSTGLYLVCWQRTVHLLRFAREIQHAVRASRWLCISCETLLCETTVINMATMRFCQVLSDNINVSITYNSVIIDSQKYNKHKRNNLIISA